MPMHSAAASRFARRCRSSESSLIVGRIVGWTLFCKHDRLDKGVKRRRRVGQTPNELFLEEVGKGIALSVVGNSSGQARRENRAGKAGVSWGRTFVCVIRG